VRLFFRYLLVTTAAVWVDHAVLPRLVPGGFAPNLSLATVVYIALAAGGLRAVVAGFVIGLASDLLGWGPVGLNALVATLAAAVFGRLRGQIYENSLLVPAAMVVLADLVLQLLSFVLAAAATGPVSFGWAVVGRVVLVPLITGLTCFPLFFAYWRLLPPPRY